MDISKQFPTTFPAQHQDKHPGMENAMNPRPVFKMQGYNSVSQKLKDKVAIITGGDSGIGRAVSIAYASEGAKVVIVYFDEHQDAEETKKLIDEAGGCSTLISGDISQEAFCKQVIDTAVKEYLVSSIC